MPTRDEYQLELGAMLLRAQGEGAAYLDVAAGELLRRAGSTAASTGELATCCGAMRDVVQPTDEALGSAGDDGPALTIRYVLPRG